MASNGNVELSNEEIEKFKDDVKDFDDEFDDAVEEVGEIADAEGNFGVSNDELAVIRGELAVDFPEDFNYLSDAYILSVASKPYSKDPTVRRPIEYTLEKLRNVMKWRDDEQACFLGDLVDLANGSPNDPAAVEDPDAFNTALALTTCVNNSSMYWHGFTKKGQPVLWFRVNRKPWYPDVDAEVKTLILFADVGVQHMPKGVTDFVVISDSTSPPPPNPQFMISLLTALVKGYPDRLGGLYSAPTNSIIQWVMNLLLPLMPGRLASKVNLKTQEEVPECLSHILLNGAADIPTFFGGTAVHDTLYPEESQLSTKGEGALKFDFYGMKKRLAEGREAYERSKK